MAEYKRIPYELVENTELARKNYIDYERQKDAPNEAEIEAQWNADLMRLNSVLNQLTTRQREVYVLIEGYQFTQRAVAEKLGIAQSTVNQTYHAAKKKTSNLVVK